MTHRYHPSWLPLDEKDAGYEQFRIAEKIRKSLEWDECGLVGGLDHIRIRKNTVRYVDRGINGKTIDLTINIKTRKTRLIRHGYEKN